MVTSACFSSRIWKFSPGDKIFQVVARSLSRDRPTLKYWTALSCSRIFFYHHLCYSSATISFSSSSAASPLSNTSRGSSGASIPPQEHHPSSSSPTKRRPSFSSSAFLLLLSLSPLLSSPRLIVRSSRLMSRVLSTPTRLVVNYPWMSYAHPTLILKLSKKNGKVSINPRSFARHRRTSRIGMGSRKNYEGYPFWLGMVKMSDNWESHEAKGVSGEKQGI